MPAITLTPAERKGLKAQAHSLHPVVMIGGDGLTAAVKREAEAALKAHGLIKVRVFSEDRDEREAVLAELADTLNAAPVQHIGKLLVLWRPKPEVVKELTPEQRKARPRTVKLVTPSKSATHRPKVRKVTVFGNERVTQGGQIKRAKARQSSIKKKAP
jgi:putative YhbY family RNA-binding protein